MATKGTIESEKFHKLYEKYDNHKTYLMACKGLADIIEEGNEEKIQLYLRKKSIKIYWKSRECCIRMYSLSFDTRTN